MSRETLQVKRRQVGVINSVDMAPALLASCVYPCPPRDSSPAAVPQHNANLVVPSIIHLELITGCVADACVQDTQP